MKEKEPFDFERFKQEAMEGLYAGKKAGGTDGVFAPLMKHLLESKARYRETQSAAPTSFLTNVFVFATIGLFLYV